MNKIRIAFFGTAHYSVAALEEMKSANMIPEVIIAQPDKPRGRNLIIAPVETKVWAEKNGVAVLQPENLDDAGFAEALRKFSCDVFIIVAYGRIIPQEILNIPPRGALNIHASLLPKYRGASPIESAILADDRETGATLMVMDEKMDHGPIVAQKKIDVKNWPPTARELGDILVSAGAKLLIEILPDWIAGKIETAPQNENLATYAKKIKKADGLINFADDPYKNFLKIQAYAAWPTAFFFAERNGKKIRVIIKKSRFENGKLEILRVIPEGKKEIDYSELLKIS